MLYELRDLHRKTRHARRHGEGGEHHFARHSRGQFRQARGLLDDRDRSAQPGPAYVEFCQFRGAKLRAELAKNPRWSGEYVPSLDPSVVDPSDVRLMNAVRPPVAPASTGNVYELRNYCASRRGGPNSGSMRLTASAVGAREISEDLSVLDHGSRSSPTKPAISGPIPTNSRAEARGAAMKDPAWQGISGRAWASGRDAPDHHAARAAPRR